MTLTKPMLFIENTGIQLFLIFVSFSAFNLISTSKPPYNEELAKKLLKLAAGAYAVSPTECISSAFPIAGEWYHFRTFNRMCDFLDNNCTFYSAISEKQNQIAIVFRGTRNKFQLFAEATQSFEKVDFNNIGKVHKYFYHGLKTLWNDVLNILQARQYRNYDVVFSGHSLGGAFASLAAAKTALLGIRPSNKILLYTFGQPRVGNPEFAKNFDRLVPASYRVVNAEDIVPHSPYCASNVFEINEPCNPLNQNSFYHHGTEIWYYNGYPGSYVECKGYPSGEDFSCSDQITLNVWSQDKYFDDHRHYLGHKVPAYGKLGCVNGDPREETLPNDAITANDWQPPSKQKGMFGSVMNNIGKFTQNLFKKF